MDAHSHVEMCAKALNAAARYPEKDPLHAQIADLRLQLAKREKVEAELRGSTVPQAEVSHMHLQLADLSTRLQECESQLARERENTKKLTAEKKQGIIPGNGQG